MRLPELVTNLSLLGGSFLLYLQILSIMGQEALSAQVVLYNEAEQDEALVEKVDMSVQANMACLRVVFLNWFVSSLLVSSMLIVLIF